MLGANSPWLEVAERAAPVAFLGAGALWVAYALLLGLQRLQLSLPGDLESFLVLAGLFAGLVGLVGLHPRLVDREPRLRTAGLTIVVVGLAAILLQLAWGGLALASIGIPNPPSLNTLVIGLAVVGGFGLYGLVGLRTDERPPWLGVLLVGHAAAVVGAAAAYGGLQLFFVAVLAGIDVAVVGLLRDASIAGA